MKLNALLIFMIAAVVLVAGCAAPKGPSADDAAAAEQVAAEQAAAEQAAAEDAAAMEAKVAGISFVSVPDEVVIGKNIEVTWTVSGDGPVKTAVFYSTKSKADVETITMDTYAGQYPKVMHEGEVGEYSASVPAGALIPWYMRAYAEVGGEGVWSEEVVVKTVVKLSDGDAMMEESDAMEE